MSAKDKGNVCLICDASMSVSTRKCCPIFEQRISNSDRTIVSVISYILGINLTEDDVHSNVICKKCFKICNEVDELEERLAELKLELSSNYQKTLKKQSGSKSPNQDIGFSETYNKSPIIKRGRGRPPLIKKEEDNDEKEIIIELLHSPGENSFNNDVPNGEENPLENEIIEVNGDDLSLDDEDADTNVDNDALHGTRIKADSDEEFVPYKLTKTMQKKKKSPGGGITRKLRENQLTTDCILIPQMVVCRENNSNTYKCLICPPELKFTADSRGIINHLRDSHNIRVYICDLCGKEFFRRPELSKHLDEHIKRDDTYECDICCRVFRNFRLYRVHRKMHVSQPKNFTCEICGKRYGSRNLLEEHKNMHTGRRPYRCSLCEKNFTSKYTLKAHEKTHEDRPRPYACINCGKTFLTQQNLIHHERIHSGITNYICKECGKSFNTARNLETHFIVHTGFKPNICRLCGKAFTKKVELRRHERSHSGEKPYQCEFCGASFSQRSNLQSHKRTTHYDDKRYKCTDCGRAFKRRRLLDYHMKAAHTGERPHKCDICDATFIYPEHFKKHKLIHTGAKPYKCEVCGKAFNSRDNRNAHRFVHSDKKPYECPVCGTGFMRKPLLYNHMNTVGHHHDTIVVNQPKLSVIEDGENFDQPIITEPIEEPSAVQHLEMTLYTDTDGSQKLIHTSALPASLEEEKYYLTDIKDHVVIPNSVNSSQGDNVHIVTAQVQYATHELNDHRIHENNQHHNLSNSIISDGIQIQANEDSILSGEPHSQANNSIAYHETATLKTENGIQILQIRINNDAQQKQWLNILQSQPQ